MHLDFASWVDVSHEQLEDMVLEHLERERGLMVSLLTLLSVVYRRNLHAMQGYHSLNDYLIRRFKMTKQQAFQRAAVARVVHDHPGLLTMLERGESCLAHLAIIAPRLTPANSQVLYNAAATMSKRELEGFAPRVAADGSIAPGDEIVTLTIRCRAECADMFDDVQALVASGHGMVSQGEVLMQALSCYLEKHDPGRKAERAMRRERKKAEKQQQIMERLEEGWSWERGHPQAVAVNKRKLAEQQLQQGKGQGQQQNVVKEEGEKRADEPGPNSRSYIPSSVKHQVWLRDEGRCTWEDAEGRRCEARHYLQFDHIRMVCHGGTDTTFNLRLRCGVHNRLVAQLQGVRRPGGERSHPDNTGLPGSRTPPFLIRGYF